MGNAIHTEKRWEVLKANKHHGTYVQDADTGRTICDLYFKQDPTDGARPLEVVHFENAEYHARLIAAAPETKGALSRQADNMAFILNHMTIPDQWYEKFSRELEEDRAVLAKTEASQ